MVPATAARPAAENRVDQVSGQYRLDRRSMDE